MADGVAGETGESAVWLVELDSKSTHAPVPIRLHLMVEHNVQDPTKKRDPVIKARALVSRWMVPIDVFKTFHSFKTP